MRGARAAAETTPALARWRTEPAWTTNLVIGDVYRAGRSIASRRGPTAVGGDETAQPTSARTMRVPMIAPTIPPQSKMSSSPMPRPSVKIR